MATATPTENEVVEEYYGFMNLICNAKFQETEKGTLYLIDEQTLQRTIVEKMMRSYDLGKLSVQNKETDSGFDVLKYLCRD